jgi:hypothetical protein
MPTSWNKPSGRVQPSAITLYLLTPDIIMVIDYGVYNYISMVTRGTALIHYSALSITLVYILPSLSPPPV